MNDLAGYREHLEANRKLAFALEGERQEVEKKRTIVLRFEGHQATGRRRVGGLVKGLKVRRLSAERGTVVDEFYGEFARGKIELHRDVPP
jgi:hypothetical protein